MKFIEIVKPNIDYVKTTLAEYRSHYRAHRSLLEAHLGRLHKIPMLNPTTNYCTCDGKLEAYLGYHQTSTKEVSYDNN